MFKPRTILIIALMVLMTILMGYSFYMLVDVGSIPIPVLIVCTGVFAFFWMWIFFGEFRTKAIKVSLDVNQLTVCRYLGLGQKKIFQLTEFTGYRTSRLSSEYQTFEFLYLVAGDRKVVMLSEFYHKNYAELKSALSKKVKYLGHEKFSLASELKEMFTSVSL